MSLRFLVVEGNVREVRERHQAHYGKMPSESYGAVLQSLEPQSIFDIAFPADEGANLPDAAGLAGYDGIFLTGSALNAYDATPEILRQVELARAIYQSKTPAFGSCWGLQMAAAAAGGSVIANPQGREIGFARKITRTADGVGHALLEGRPASWDAPAIHLDIVGTLPSDVTILASNAMTPVQAAEIRHDGGVFWAVQYHPEYGLPELCTILARYKDRMLAEGFLRTSEDHAAYLADMVALGADPSRADLAWKHGVDREILDEKQRLTELRNFIAHRVKPHKSARGRA
jgi:GMP synthase (glutamine-hydrolysing)